MGFASAQRGAVWTACRCAMTLGLDSSATPRVLVTRGLATPEAWIGRLAESLRPIRLDVLPVQSAGRVAERVSRLRPRVVVVDEPSLAGVGWSLLRRIRRIDGSVACLMVVSRAEPTLLSQALQLSAYSVFEMPVDVDLMGKMVSRLLRRVN